MPHAAVRTLIRSCALLALVASALLLGSAEPGRAEGTSRQIVLLGPTDGVIVHSSMEPGPTPVTFCWRIDWQPTTPDPVTISWRMADDPNFTQNVVGETRVCPAGIVNCWTSFTPRRIYLHKYYRKVVITAPAQAESVVWSLAGTPPPPPPDTDRDGMPNAKDTVPGFGIQRRSTVTTTAAVTPATLIGRSRASAQRRDRRSVAPPRTSRCAIYRVCVKAWHVAGHSASDCAPYRVL